MDNDRDISASGGACDASFTPKVRRRRGAAEWRARLARALEPFALVAQGWLGRATTGRARARAHNLAVAAKLALLADARAVAALRARLGGLPALLAWERRASRVVEAITVRPPEVEAAELARQARVDAAMAEIEAHLAEALAMGRAWAGEAVPPIAEREDDRVRRSVRFALPTLPKAQAGRAAYRIPRAMGTSSVPSRRRARVVAVWPRELMSAEENAELAERRAARAAKLAEVERLVKIAERGEAEGENSMAAAPSWTAPIGFRSLEIREADRVRDGPEARGVGA